MKKTFKSCDRNQMLLLPPSLLDWLPEGHLARFIIDVVEQLDLTCIYSSYKGDGRGYPPYEPRMMISLLFYAYCSGVVSSRKIERKTHEDIALIAANRHPDHDSICAFRKRHLSALSDLFVQILRLCQEAGLVRLGHMALDGTKIKANASKHKAMSYGRMKKRKEELESEVKELLEQANSADEEEDRKYGKGKKGWDLPDELHRRETRLQKIKEAMQALEDEAVTEEKKRKKKDAGPAAPDEKTQRNFTDPDSRIMKVSSTKSFDQCYNGQAVVDSESQVIVSCHLTQSSTDSNEVKPALEGVKQNLGFIPFKLSMSMDTAYFSEGNVALLEDAGIDPFIATRRRKHSEPIPPAPRGRIPKDLTPAERMERKLRTVKGRATYARRKVIIEPVFGQIKQVRGLRQFLLRGFENTSAEWTLWCLTHNLLKLYRDLS